MKWRHLGHLQLLSRVVEALMTGMAKIQVGPQEEIANPQDMKVFAVERHGLPEDFVSFRALCGVQSPPLVFAPNREIVWGPLQWQAPVETLCFRFAFSRELSAQVRRPNKLLHVVYSSRRYGHFHYAHRPKRLSVRRERRPRAFVV